MSNNPSLPKLAFYCSSASWGGLEMKTLRYAKALQAEGFQVCTYVVEGTPLFQHAIELNLPMQVVARNKKYFDFKHARQVAKLFEKEEIDAVHFSDTRDLDFLGWVKYFSKRKIKLAYHQAMILGVTKKDFIHTIRFKRIDAWVSTLNYMQKQVLTHTRLSAEKLHIIPIGTAISASTRLSKEQARAELNLPPDKFIVGIVGRLDPKKGQLEVIQAIPLVQHSDKKIQVVFLGDKTKNESDDYVQELKNSITDSLLEEVVTFIPHQPNIQQMYNAFDMVIVPSWEETFGMVTIEAMASGVAVIGSNTAGTAEILENKKYLFEPKNPTQLSKTWLEVMTNDSDRKNWAIQLEQKFQEKYSMQSSIHAWKQLLIQTVEHD
jgi:glycosyltransferase involved in cell wall biosynthesis